jgi:cell wall-associated NlpC family hydrolase
MKFIKNKTLQGLLLITTVILSIFVTDIYSQPGARGFKNDQSLSAPSDTIRSDTSGYFYKEATIDSLIQFGKQFLGLAYHYGGTTPAGFDCSGYVSYLYRHFGYNLPSSSSGMAYVGSEVPYKDARKGDLILFKGRNSASTRVGHVALIINVDSLGVTMMHSCNRGVKIDRYPQMEYYRTRFVAVRRVKL